MAQLRVFVCHATPDTAFCDALVTALRTGGADVWYDEHHQTTGLGQRAILQELAERSAYVVVLSQAALGSEWVRNACAWASDLAARGTPERLLLVVVAAPYDLQHAAVLLAPARWHYVEASRGQPLPPGQGISQALHLLGLTAAAGGAAGAGAAQPSTDSLSPARTAAELIAGGQALLAQHLYAEAVIVFERATQRDPASGTAWAHLGAAHCALEQWQQALAALERALALQAPPASAPPAWVWHTKGWALGGLGRYEEELGAYEQALARDPAFAASWNNRGVALRALQRYDEALASLDRALALDPHQAAPWNNKGNVLRLLRRYDEAAAAVDRALKIEPGSARCWTTKGELAYAEQRFAEALDCFTQALTLYPSYGEAWHQKGLALRALGRLGEAEQAERRARELGWQSGKDT